MNFKDAMLELQRGSKVTRQQWIGSIYFVLETSHIKSYQPRLETFIYDEDIMLSAHWLVEGQTEEKMFYDIISNLYNGEKARQASWKDEDYIFIQFPERKLIRHLMAEFPYVVDFDSFCASDWVKII